MPKAPTRARTKASTKAPVRSKNPKDSHLYTDDNPATTIHGTGFKDKAAALRTLNLIKNRSLTYQFQTVNTMYHRAKHHPSMKKKIEGSAGVSDMVEAMNVFRHWLDVTYPAERANLRAGGFKPMLSKACVERYLTQINGTAEVNDQAKAFAKVYVELPKGKKLANVLVNNSKPTEADWERLRYDSLNDLVPKSFEESSDQQRSRELWSDDGRITTWHLSLIAWAWSMEKESKLP